MRRVFIIVLDSLGIGELPDARRYGDEGSHTLRACVNTGRLRIPNLQRLGLYNIDGVDCGQQAYAPLAAHARMTEASAGKDTTIGHWEIAGVISPKPLPTYPNGFPNEIIAPFENTTGQKVLCNRPASGTQVLLDYGREHVESGNIIVYTSADSVLQIAAHEEVVSVRKLYEYCELFREILTGEHNVGRVIARPFVGEYPNYRRTASRHDFSLTPPKATCLDRLHEAGLDTIGVGKINDIFAGRGIGRTQTTVSDDDGMLKTIEHAKEDFNGLCFVNLVDFDMLYGHRNDADGYAEALNRFDVRLGELLQLMKEDDVLMLTADHGCDPATLSTDHSREYAPLLIYGTRLKKLNLGTRSTFADIGETAADFLGVQARTDGESFAALLINS